MYKKREFDNIESFITLDAYDNLLSYEYTLFSCLKNRRTPSEINIVANDLIYIKIY